MRRSGAHAVTSIAVFAAIAAASPAAPAGAARRWAPADKHGFGTSATTASRVWFTLRQREISEVYWPDLGTPAVRDLRFAVTSGGRTRTDASAATASVTPADPRALVYRQVSATTRWRLTKTLVTDPERDALLVRVRLRSLDGRRHRLRAVLDPGLSNSLTNDRGRRRGGGLVAYDRRGAVAMQATGMRDRRTNRRGDVVQSARIAATATVVLGFGRTPARAVAMARAARRAGFARAQSAYTAGWHAHLDALPPAPASLPADLRPLYDRSLMVMAALEDKANRGAGVASPSMPWAWGRLTIDRPSAPYHLVWARDLYQVGSALIAAGDREAANRALDFLLERQQRDDGSFPQNSEVDGTPHWTGLQLDEVALPIVLAWQLGRTDATTWAGVRRAADFIRRRGPRTGQERWENEGGYSPATIAAQVAALVCAAEIARANGDAARAGAYLATADEWQRSVQSWTATSTGPYRPAPYYLRITKRARPDAGLRYSIGDGGPSRADQRRIVDPSFLELVRLGVKRWDDPAILNTLQVVDDQLAVSTPNGRFWHRFTFDGYGETPAGAPWDLSDDDSYRTLGRAWPIFAGERGEYELLAGRPAHDELRAIAASANDGLMLPEQVWDGRPPTGSGGRADGEGTQSATPLAWTHAQFVRLAWSIEAGRPVEQPSVVACRYARQC